MKDNLNINNQSEKNSIDGLIITLLIVLVVTLSIVAIRLKNTVKEQENQIKYLRIERVEVEMNHRMQTDTLYISKPSYIILRGVDFHQVLVEEIR